MPKKLDASFIPKPPPTQEEKHKNSMKKFFKTEKQGITKPSIDRKAKERQEVEAFIKQLQQKAEEDPKPGNQSPKR